MTKLTKRMLAERLATVVEARDILTSAQLQKAATIRAGLKQLCTQMRTLLGTPTAG